MKKSRLFVKNGKSIALLFLFTSQVSLSQNVITTLPYNPGVTNFNAYNPSSSANALATIPAGWSFGSAGTAAYGGQIIFASTTGGYYACAGLLSADYNMGALRDANTGNITYNVNYTNNTGGLITTLVFTWNYEQWGFANNSGWSCAGTGALAGNSTLASKNYVGTNFSFLNAPVTAAIASFTLSGLSIANGASFGIAWTTTDGSGADNTVAIDDFSMNASSIASITIANGTTPAGNINQTSTNNVLYRADITVSVTPATLNSVSLTTAGTYVAANLSNIKLWYSSSPAFSPTATLLGTKTTALGTGIKAFTGLSQIIPLGTGYIFLTADLACSGPGNTINVSAINTSNFTFFNGVKSGSGFTAGGAQTIILPGVNAVSNRSVCSGKNFAGVTFTTSPAGINVFWTNSNTAIGLASSGSGNIASYTSPVVGANQTGALVVTAANGTCIGTSTGFNILVKNNGQSSTVWTGVVSGDWSDADNWTNCACGSITNATIAAVAGPAFTPTFNAGSVVNNITINPGAILAGQVSQSLTVFGNWLNHGGYSSRKNCIVFNGGSAQTVGGTAITSFDDVVLNNSAGLTLTSSQFLNGNLQLINGVLNTNNLLTLTANSLTTGRIGPIRPTADIINNVTIQQWVPGGSTGWALLGTSIFPSHALADWNDDFAITCPGCPDGYGGFNSVYSYDESIAGSYSATAKYIPLTDIADNIIVGKGYWVYLGDNYPNTSDIILDVTGPVAKSSCLSCGSEVTIPVSFTSNNGLTNDGWNLVSNPLPSPISWTALRNGNASVDDAIYIYNTDLNGGPGAHTSYINGVSSNPVNGVTDIIPIHQGFYIHATAPTILTASENIKVNSTPLFLRPASASKPIFRLVLNDNGSFEDMCAFYFEQGGSLNFQTDFDAYKLNYDEATLPYLGSMSGTVLTSINGLPLLNTNFSIPVKAITPVSKSFTFSTLQTDFPNNVCVTLYDSYTNITTNLITDSYTCTLYDTTTVARFSINFFTGSSVGTSSLKQPDCPSPDGGVVSAKGQGNGPWNYTWKSGNTILKTSLSKSTADSLTGLSGGNYFVSVSTVGQCDIFSPTFILTPVISPLAYFVPQTFTATLSNSGQVSFTDYSSGAISRFWDFGDNSGTSTLTHPQYNYKAPGTYTVTLVTESSTSCMDTVQEVIHVIDDVTGINDFEKDNNILLASHGQNQYSLKISFESPASLEIHLYDLKGSLLKKTIIESVSQTEEPVDLSSYPPGLYMLTVVKDKNTQRTFKLTN